MGWRARHQPIMGLRLELFCCNAGVGCMHAHMPGEVQRSSWSRVISPDGGELFLAPQDTLSSFSTRCCSNKRLSLFPTNMLLNGKHGMKHTGCLLWTHTRVSAPSVSLRSPVASAHVPVILQGQGGIDSAAAALTPGRSMKLWILVFLMLHKTTC